MENEFSFKEIYDAKLKACQPMLGFEAGETVIEFDRVQSLSIQGIVRRTSANGGFDNRPLVWWENATGARLYLSQGVVSESHRAIMSNSKLFKEEGGTLIIPIRETLESDEEGIIQLKYKPLSPFFIYDKEGNKLSWETLGPWTIKIEKPMQTVIADYYFNYNNNYKYLKFGMMAAESQYFDFSCKTRVKDDISGLERTAYIHIPKVKLLADISIKLGIKGAPSVETINAQAIPIGKKGNVSVMEMYYLDNDIDADI